MAIHWPSVDQVMLDMDGTILDLAFDNYFWGEVVPARYAERKQVTFAAALAELRPHFEALRGTLPWYSLTHWSALTGLDLVKLKHEVRQRSGPLAGAPDFLRAVKASGRQMWLVTNADPHALDIKQMHSGLAAQFDRLISAHDFDAPKEDARFWPRLAARFPFDKARALYVDDNAAVLAAARDYGIGQLVAIRHPDSKRPARDVPGFTMVDRLADLLPVPPTPAA
ncbi:MAG: GMP/IMP nucleotidase [Gammaproteobacteria bacterium]